MISGFQNSESYPDMLFNKKEYQKRSLESASERVLARNAQLEVALSRWLLSKEGPPLDFSISKHMARNHSSAKKAEINHLNSPKFSCKEFSTFKKSMSTDFSPKIPQKFLTYIYIYIL